MYETFKDLEAVNEALERWSIEARLVKKAGIQVATLVLIEEGVIQLESQSLNHLLDFVTDIEGTRWARRHWLLK